MSNTILEKFINFLTKIFPFLIQTIFRSWCLYGMHTSIEKDMNIPTPDAEKGYVKEMFCQKTNSRDTYEKKTSGANHNSISCFWLERQNPGV